MSTATLPRPTEEELRSWLQQFHSYLPVPFGGTAKELLEKAYMEAHPASPPATQAAPAAA